MVGLVDLIIDACVLEVKDVSMDAELKLATCNYFQRARACPAEEGQD
jgi:hypothetical protein